MSLFDIELTDIDVLPTIDRFMNLDFGPFLREAGEAMVETTQARMERGLDPDENRQPENIGAYRQWKEAKYGGPPMMLTGELHDVITAFVEKGNVTVWVPKGLHAIIPDLPSYLKQDPRDYEAIVTGHETGERALGRKRPIFGMNERDIDLIYHLFQKMFEPEFT